MKGFFYNIKHGVANLIRWFPIVWRDRDWDYEYLLLLLEFKLENMSKLHHTHGNLEKSKRVADELGELSQLAGELVKQDYAKKTSERYDELLDKLKVSIEENTIKTSGLTEEERKELSKLSKDGVKLWKQDVERLFSTIGSKMNTWWD